MDILQVAMKSGSKSVLLCVIGLKRSYSVKVAQDPKFATKLNLF